MRPKFLLALAPLTLAASLAACGPKTDKAADDLGKAGENALTAVGDTASNVASAAGNAIDPTPTAQDFVDMAAKSDAFEIAAAKLAQTHGQSAAVKAFAAKMIAAHTASTAKIKAAAAKASPAIKPDPLLNTKQDQMLADLGKLNGADFDKAYASNQVDAHEDALSLMKNYADKGTAPTLKAAAGEIAPDVQDHLVMARALPTK